MKPIVITGSGMQDFDRCPRYWYVKHVLGRSEHEESEALNFGIFWHKLCAGELDVNDPLAQIYLEGLSLPLRTAVEIGFPQWEKWWAESGYETVATEQMLERTYTPLDVGVYSLRGTPDRIVRDDLGVYWHIQHKTLTGNVKNFTWKVARSWHEVLYRTLGEAAGYTPWGGTILACLNKLSAEAMEDPEPRAVGVYKTSRKCPDGDGYLYKKGDTKYRSGRGENPFSIEYITPDSRLTGAMDNVIARMLNWAKHQDLDPMLAQPNLNSCVYGGGHWRTCQYLQHCEGLRDWSTLPEHDPLARYKETSNDTT